MLCGTHTHDNQSERVVKISISPADMALGTVNNCIYMTRSVCNMDWHLLQCYMYERINVCICASVLLYNNTLAVAPVCDVFISNKSHWWNPISKVRFTTINCWCHICSCKFPLDVQFVRFYLVFLYEELWWQRITVSVIRISILRVIDSNQFYAFHLLTVLPICVHGATTPTLIHYSYVRW